MRNVQAIAWMLLTLLLPLSAGAQEPQKPAAAPPAGQGSLVGRVVQIYTSERRLSPESIDTLYAFEVRVTEVQGLEGVQTGDDVVVKTWHAASRPAGWIGELGQREIPDRGDVARFRISGGRTVLEAAMSDGIQIVLPGRWQGGAIGLPMNLIGAGDFQIGSPPASEASARPEERPHAVRLTRPFYLGVYEVTQLEFWQVMRRKPSSFSFGGSNRVHVTRMVTERFPVEGVSWYDAVEFCNRLSRQDGLPEYYRIDAVEKLGETVVAAKVTTVDGPGYRLPTEAEWEFACRAGTSTPFHCGRSLTLQSRDLVATQSDLRDRLANHSKTLRRPNKVGSYPPNEWGLFDMHGNVAEWCEDWYDPDWGGQGTDGAVVVDPHGPHAGTEKVLRGGGWSTEERECRSASRLALPPRETREFGGFRIARHAR